MSIYYIDYENVSSQGLKGIEGLTKDDEVNILYSKKADNVKIDILTMLMKSQASIHFLPVHVGTPNALDFQLVTLLFLHYKQGVMHYIISKDSGYDCCLKTAAENGADQVARFPNIESALNNVQPKPATRRGKRSGSSPQEPVIRQPQGSGTAKNPKAEQAVSAPAAQDAEAAAQISAPAAQDAEALVPQNGQEAASDAEKPKKKPTRRGGRGRKKQNTETAEPQAPEAEQAETAQTGDRARENQSGERARDGRENQNGARTNEKQNAQSSKPATILSVIRRRNDVQLDMHQIDLIRNALKTSNKQQFYNCFVKKLGQKQGIDLYKQVKSSYTDLINANLTDR